MCAVYVYSLYSNDISLRSSVNVRVLKLHFSIDSLYLTCLEPLIGPTVGWSATVSLERTVNGWTSLPCICEIWIVMNSLYFSVYQDCHPVLLLSFTATKSSQKKFRRLKGKISNRLVAHDSSSLLLLPPQQWHNVAAIVAADVELCCSTLI